MLYILCIIFIIYSFWCYCEWSYLSYHCFWQLLGAFFCFLAQISQPPQRMTRKCQWGGLCADRHGVGGSNLQQECHWLTPSATVQCSLGFYQSGLPNLFMNLIHPLSPKMAVLEDSFQLQCCFLDRGCAELLTSSFWVLLPSVWQRLSLDAAWRVSSGKNPLHFVCTKWPGEIHSPVRFSHKFFSLLIINYVVLFSRVCMQQFYSFSSNE